MRRLLAGLFAVSILPVALIASCKQSEGERCQVDDDCEDPLVCAQATMTCAESQTSAGLDALVPLDAPDAMPIDAPDAM